eukprot:TRINITY_DN69477_c0_g1_i1.p1 TRINITY_DN69477_c0_g1~~TRINITY_DN69477_c0_g1_i1.p1  ORF type:complete len:400 (-),score=55.41 TRINITY_DN69477_c0_g1_i1:44-1243(-)
MKSLDAFGRPVQEFQVKTACGGYLSVCSFCVIAILFLTELKYFLVLDTKDEMVIDQNQDQKYLNISLNLTFSKVPCSVVHLNLIDTKKANVMHVSHEIYKTRISGIDRTQIGPKIRDSLVNVAQTSAEMAEAGLHNITVRTTHATPHLRCNSCYQSHIDEDDCCSSCEDVHKAFKIRGWDIPSDYIFSQCIEEAYRRHPSVQDEGCNIVARLHVRKVAATIHLGVGRHFRADILNRNNFHDFVTSLDFSHEIGELSFGVPFPGLVRVLDGSTKSFHTPGMSEHFQYDVHVIPTRYKEDGFDEITSHQYSVTEYVKSIDHRRRHQELVALGIWANYDFTPFEVKVTRSRKAFSHFFTECCAILGGIFAFTGMLDNFAYQINRSVGGRRGGSMQLAAMGPQ